MKKMILNLSFAILFISTAAVCKDIMPKFPLPGSSLADPVLQKDTFKPIYAMTKTLDKSCNDISVVNTKVVQIPQNLVKENGRYVGGEWSEIWTINYCGKTKDYPIVFIMDKNGTTYKIDNEK